MSDIKISVPQIQIPAEAVRGLIDNLKTAQKAISPMGQRVAKVLDTQRQFFSQYQYVGFVKKSDLALTQQVPPKPMEPEQPQKTSKSRTQRNHRVKDKDLEKARKIVMKYPELTNEYICAILGVNENCAGYNKDGSPKKLRVVIDYAREASIGGSYKTGEEGDEAADAFLQANLTNKIKHKQRGEDMKKD